ncbi:hypothetical protein KM427_16095 [Nocardioides sp. LMS-CY]|uniref:PIN domain-containing protein n=1 Tax=Nocardioides soli TaxID=1036020 RepID=A0A7W4VYT9_9ACTN|nr:MULTISPECIES: hypothetical protein [Nocardioides]MBB3044244.1 hypothetical protein [Nocardioides soli]QWF20500.1 hypothetical protein KM427_16095 [Nocardioides sp. LMS-CY]
MTETKYLVDNNALIFLGTKRNASHFFREYCRVPEEVAHEAGTRRAELLTPLTVPMSVRILNELSAVMKTVPVGDKGLLDLYGNRGAADPVLVATAVVLNKPEKPTLFEEEWVIVTNDRAVRDKAKEFDVKTATPEALAALIDAAGSPAD